MASRPPEKDASYLMTLKQQKTEHLWDYLTRFTKVMYEILSLDAAIAIEAFKQGVQHRSAFHLSISKQKITTFEQIKLKVEKYIRQSDALDAREKNGPSVKTDEPTSNTTQGKKRDRGPVKDRLGPGSMY